MKYILIAALPLILVAAPSGCGEGRTADRSTTRSLLEEAVEQAKAGNAEEALKLVEQAGQEDPGNNDIWASKAVILARLGRVNESEQAMREAISLGRNPADICLMVGDTLIAANREEDARRLLLESLDSGLSDPEMLQILGCDLIEVGLVRKAFDAFVRAYDICLDQSRVSGRSDCQTPLMMRFAADVFASSEYFEALSTCGLLDAQLEDAPYRTAEGYPTLSREEIQTRIAELRVQALEASRKSEPPR
jgi:tetratricopeptide (TPR) repeat protein